MIAIERITCNGESSLIGADASSLLFSWIIKSKKLAVIQRRYQLQISTDAQFASLNYDSGWIEDNSSIHIQAPNFIPVVRQRYFYRVRIEDQHCDVTEWSACGFFETAPSANCVWQGQWITPDDETTADESVHLLKRAFQLPAQVSKATLYASALGIYQMHINNKPLGDELFSPGWTSYQHHIQFQSWDVGYLLQEGSNEIGAGLAEGWYKGELSWLKKRHLYGDRKALFVQLHITLENGEEHLLLSDGQWQCCLAPQLHSSFYQGEAWDARLENVSHESRAWSSVNIIEKPISGLTAQISEPVRVTQTLVPEKIISREGSRAIVDMGQNMVGRIRICAKLAEDERVELRHAEVLDNKNDLYTDNLRGAAQRVSIIGNGEDIDYAANFSFQGFRYIEIIGLGTLNDKQLMDAIRGEVLHTDMARTGSFSCSNNDINKLYQNIVWGQRGNFVDVPTDCPQRDERLGWTGDAHIFIRTAAYNYDVRRFFKKWLRSLAADQKSNGTVPMVIPDILRDYISKIWGDKTYTSSGWGDAAVICPWVLYEMYGDKQLLAEQWPSMKAWVHYIHSTGENPWLWESGFQFGDWLALDAEPDSYFGATPVYLVASAFYAHSTHLLARTAAVLGLEGEAQLYQKWFENIKSSFQEKFLSRAGGMCADTQTAHILPLAFQLLDDCTAKKVATRLNELVVANDYHLTTGFLGTPWLCTALSEYGYHDTAVRLICQTTFPSWLFSVKQGATTIWEHWDGIKTDGSFWSENMNSFNHYAYGAIGEWLYRYLAGLDMEDGAVAFNRINFRPDMNNTLINWAEACHESPYGRVSIHWKREELTGEIQLSVPCNTQACIQLPEGWQLAEEEEISLLKLEPHARRWHLGSGNYCLRVVKK
ncbi:MULTISPECIES: alpha-L-rhamnosidase [unclassified Raoultella]|uniref:alpha-L-rhamnosidase n=1 Tax=unclassified Raoultella TaxID=2627600 RepID=UPI00135C2661|nr:MULTISPECIES: alpha-L-rhamnosidase [unclassified Raoultella]